MKIVGILKPFSLEQTFFVLDNGEKIDEISCSITKLNETVLNLSQQYSINQIDLTGPKSYTIGIKNQIEQAELHKYNLNNLTINII